MSAAWLGAAVGAALSGGVLLAATGWARSRRPALHDRVAPYVRDVLPTLAVPTGRGPSASALARWAAERLGETLGGTESVRRRLDRLDGNLTVEGFRMKQLRWAGTGLAVGVLMALAIWARRPAAPFALLILCVAAGVAGALACDQDLTSRVTRRERRMAEELPALTDLLAIAVAAGESPTAALRRVVGRARGDLADELSRVVGEIHAGSTVVDAFDALSARTGVASIARFAEGLAVAVERGTPIVEVLHAQTADVREAARRDLIESGGRREVLMMVPVVFLILPVTVIFAFYPGLVGLSLTSGT